MSHPNNPHFNTFIFDLDGTLLDTLPDLVVLTNTALERCGLPTRTEAEIQSYVGNGVSALMYQAVPENTPADKTEEAYALWHKLFPDYTNDLTHPYPGIVNLLVELRKRGCKIGVVSNKFEAGVFQILDKCLPGLIDVAHGEAPDFPRKPDPTGILRTIDELQSTPTQTVYIGDSPGDITAGKNAGVFTVAVTWGYHEAADFTAVNPDMVVGKPEKLLELA